MPNRHTGNSKYRYGYQGSESDDEVHGTKGTSYTTHFRQLDVRIGRWLSRDPMADKFPWQSAYVSMDNSPVLKNDPLGLWGEKKAERKRKRAVRRYGENRVSTVKENPNKEGDYGFTVINNPDGDNETHSCDGGVMAYETTGVYKNIDFRKFDRGQPGHGVMVALDLISDVDDYARILTPIGILVDAQKYNLVSAYNNIFSRGWNNSSGKWFDAKILKKGSNGKYVRGVQGYRNSQNIIASTTKLKVATISKIGNKIFIIGTLYNGVKLTVALVDGDYETVLEAGTDLTLGVVMAFGGPIGLVIGGVYYGVDYFFGWDNVIQGVQDIPKEFGNWYQEGVNNRGGGNELDAWYNSFGF